MTYEELLLIATEGTVNAYSVRAPVRVLSHFDKLQSSLFPVFAN